MKDYLADFDGLSGVFTFRVFVFEFWFQFIAASGFWFYSFRMLDA